MLKLRYANVPVISAIRGMALGGGCEIAVHSRAPRGRHGKLHRPGRSGRGPGAGRRWPDLHRAPRRRNAATSTDKDLLKFLTEGFTAAAMAKVGTSAIESRKLGYLLDSDIIVPNKDELLYVA
jgi:3-hydroxyacyl-CoA dehydrogenase